MDLREYQARIAEDNPLSVVEQAQELARCLRTILRLAAFLGYSAEELASLDQEGT